MGENKGQVIERGGKRERVGWGSRLEKREVRCTCSK